MDLNSQQFALFPKPKFPGNARGFVGPHSAPAATNAQNPHNTYIRFGDWPHNERSRNNVTGGTEDGVSAYDMKGSLAEPVDPDPHGSRYERALGDDDDGFAGEMYGNDTGEEMEGRRDRAFHATRNFQSWEHHDDVPSSLRGHFVTGRLVSFGHDDEPLLRDVRQVGEWPRHAHRFVPGEQDGLFPERGLRRND